MIDGGGGGTRDRREEGTAANLKSQILLIIQFLMRNKGKRGGRAVDSDDSQSQVMSPRLPQTPTITDQTASVSVQHGSVPLAVSPGSVSHNTNTFIASPLPVGSSRFSDSSLSVLQQFQRHTLRAPVLRNFAVSEFRVWHQQFCTIYDACWCGVRSRASISGAFGSPDFTRYSGRGGATPN